MSTQTKGKKLNTYDPVSLTLPAATDFNGHPPFEINAPAEQRVPFVFNSPHSGCQYPISFLESARLDSHTIRRSEDAYVDHLFSHVVPLGAPILKAHFPRAYLDVNREPYELDPKMFADPLPSYVNARSVRVASGLGTIAKVVSDSKEIYRHRLPVSEALYRIEEIYKPYHASLRGLIARTHVTFGYSVLIDCHSMPSSVKCPTSGQQPDFIIGDRYGTSCAPELTEYAIHLLRQLGYNVTHNKPYAGGFITEHYGRPSKGLHAVQIEINRSLYMDEASYAPNERFSRTRTDLEQFILELTAMPDDCLIIDNLAAE